MSKLTRQDVPAASFEFARSRTAGLIDEMGFFRMSQVLRPGDTIGDALANAYLQGVCDCAQVIANNPSMVGAKVDEQSAERKQEA